MHGATDYGGYHLGGVKMLAVRSGKVVRDIPWRPWAARIQAGRGCPGIPGQAWRPRWLEGRPKGGTEGSDGARHTLSTVCSGGQGRNVRENVTYFEHQEKEQMLLMNQGAKYVTHTDVS